jgi:hypothetical protein
MRRVFNLSLLPLVFGVLCFGWVAWQASRPSAPIPQREPPLTPLLTAAERQAIEEVIEEHSHKPRPFLN